MSGAERLLNLMEKIPDDMLEEAWVRKQTRGGRIKIVLCGAAAAACLMVLFMFFVPAGQVVAAQIKESIADWLEQLFPPRELPVRPEGEEETVPHEALYSGRFAIYFDPDSFEAAEEGDRYVIRQKRIVYTREEAVSGMGALLGGLSEEEAERKIQERMEEAQAFYDSLPVCEIRITQMSRIAPEDAAEKLREEFLAQYENVSEITAASLVDGLYLYGDQGAQADSGVAEAYFVDNGLGGVFIIQAVYYMEAAEGIGARFHAMIGTFEVLPPQLSGE